MCQELFWNVDQKADRYKRVNKNKAISNITSKQDNKRASQGIWAYL